MPGQKFELKPGEPLLKSQPSVLEKNVSISLKSIVFVAVAVLFLSSSFLAGRYVFPSTVPIGSVFAAIGETPNTTSAVAPTTETSEETTPVVVVDEGNGTEPTSEAVAEESAAEPAAADIPVEAAPISDTVVTTYSKVKLEFTRDPVFKWYDDQGYGDIKTIYYTVTNNEAGTIKPSYFSIVIEGYSPTERTIIVAVPHNTELVAAGKVVQNAFDKNIAYRSDVTDPANIKVTLLLFDENKKQVAKAEKEFNLKG